MGDRIAVKRYTTKNAGVYSVPQEDLHNAIQELGKFEDAWENLMISQAQIPLDLEKMRTEGKEKTVRYKETVAQKLINNSIVLFLEKYGLKG